MGVLAAGRGLARHVLDQGGAQRQPAAVHPGLDGGRLDPQDGADLDQRQLGDLFEHQRQPVVRRQPRERAIDDLGRLPALLLARRIAVGGRQPGHQGQSGKHLVIERFDARRLARAPPLHALAAAGGDRVEPGRRIRAALELIPLAVGLEEGLLHQVLGVGRVAAELEAEGEHLSAQLLDQLRDRLVRAAGVEGLFCARIRHHARVYFAARPPLARPFSDVHRRPAAARRLPHRQGAQVAIGAERSSSGMAKASTRWSAWGRSSPHSLTTCLRIARALALSR